MAHTVDQKTIIITGVSSGLGKALFDILRTSGARLVCVSRNFLEEQKALEGENLILLPCDLSKAEEVHELVKKLAEVTAHATEVVYIDNAATIQPIGRIGTLEESAVKAAVQTNFITPMLISNALRAQGRERLTVVHVSTGAARTPIIGWPLYCATKAGLKMFYSILAAQEEGGKVHVHQFDPGIMDTPMQAQIRKASGEVFPRLEEFKKYKKDRELSDPKEVAERLVRECLPV